MKKLFSLFFAVMFCAGLTIPSYAVNMENEETIHTVVVAGETFYIAESESESGLNTFWLANNVSPDKMYLAEIAMEMAANPDYDPYAVEPTATTNTVYVTTAGVEYYRRVIDEPSNLHHATTMATYESNNASYSNSGHDTISSDCSTAWYGSAIPTTTSVEHIITFYVEDTEAKLELSTVPSAAASFQTTYEKITINYELELQGTQLARINGADAVVYNPDLQGGFITHCVASTRGTVLVGNTQYNARADVRFENSVY